MLGAQSEHQGRQGCRAVRNRCKEVKKIDVETPEYERQDIPPPAVRGISRQSYAIGADPCARLAFEV